MRIFGWTIERTSIGRLRLLDRFREDRVKQATHVVDSGNIYGFIYGAFDRRLGRTVWRFSLDKVIVDKGTGDKVFLKSFKLEDEEDLYKAVYKSLDYIRRVTGQ
jgi:hypothetical protein